MHTLKNKPPTYATRNASRALYRSLLQKRLIIVCISSSLRVTYMRAFFECVDYTVARCSAESKIHSEKSYTPKKEPIHTPNSFSFFFNHTNSVHTHKSATYPIQPRKALYTHTRALYTYKRAVYTCKSPTYTLKSPIQPHKSSIHTQTSPIHLQKSPTHPQKGPTHLQKSPTHPQKGPIHLHKSFIHTSNSIFLHNMMSIHT